MDREISPKELRKKTNRRWWYGAAALVLLLVAIFMLRNALGNTVQRSAIRIAVAETGNVENTLTASGEVLPEFEQIVTSPVSAVLQQVYFSTGATVKPGDKILELDKVTTQIELEKQKDELDLRRNGIVKTRLELDKSFFDIQIQDSIKACRITSLKADLENAKRLFKAGGGTRESIEQAETNLAVARLEKRQLENDIRTRQSIMQTGIRESEITASMQQKALREMERKLGQTNITATRSGVLTFVHTSLGAKVTEGETLARIADLSSFKILGTISDAYAAQLRVGMPVIVRINDKEVRGELLNIRPAISNNVISFDVSLSDKAANNLLRPRMKLEIFLVTDAHNNTVRVTNGPAFNGTASQTVFVLRPDGTAERRNVKTGLSSFDFIEITEGVQAGETIIISDMSAFRNAATVKVN